MLKKIKKLFKTNTHYTFHMKSGKSLEFKAYNITITKHGNELTGYEIDGKGTGMFFVSLVEIEAITCK
jgi:hypothetical protein